MADLTEKQKRFVAEYLIDLNGTQAAIRAGYSPRTAQEQASALLSKPIVSQAVSEAQRASLERVGITADRVKQELARIALSDPRALYNPDGSMKPPSEWSDDAAATIGGIESGPLGVTKIRRWDKNAALAILAKHFGLVTERHEITGKDGGPIQIQPVKPEDLSDETIERILREAGRKSLTDGKP